MSELPAGISGLVIAGVMAAGMSTLDSSINVSATVFTVDFYKRIIRSPIDDARLLSVTRWSSVVFGVLGTLASLLMITQETVLDAWWRFSSIFGGAMLGLFLVGIIVRKATSRGAILGAMAGVLLIVWGTTFPHLEGDAAWHRFPYHANMIGPISTLVIVTVAWLESRITR